jgi:hypothetical protein
VLILLRQLVFGSRRQCERDTAVAIVTANAHDDAGTVCKRTDR